MATTADAVVNEMLGGLKPKRSGNVDVSCGARIYWEVYGPSGWDDGKQLVLINGANGKIPFLGFIIQRFVRLGYQVLVHEARGIGRSSCPTGQQTTQLLAADTLLLVDGVLGPACRFHLMGVSMGGMVAQELLYMMVRGGQASRVQAAFLMVCDAGKRWRPLPWRRAGNVRRTTVPLLGFTDQAAFEARFPPLIAASWSAAWLDGPAPPPPLSKREDQPTPQPTRDLQPTPQPAPSPQVPQAHQEQQPQQERQQEEEQEEEQEGVQEGEQEQTETGGRSAAAAAAPAAPAAPATRREAVLRLWVDHWRELSAMSVEEMEGVTWHMTAQLSHFLGPRRAAAIRAGGVKLGVGISSADCFYTEHRQHALAAALGAETHRVGAGHCDSVWLDGVGWMVGAALATFGDSR